MGLFGNIFGNNLNVKDNSNERTLNSSYIDGLEKFRKNLYHDSIEDFDRAIDQNPMVPDYFIMRGIAYVNTGKDLLGEFDFKKAVEIQPENYVAAFQMGMLYYEHKMLEKAVEWLKQSFKYAPNEPRKEQIGFERNSMFVSKQIIAGNLGNFLIKLERLDESIKYLIEAIKIDPNYVHAYSLLGLAYSDLGKNNEAINYLKKASELGDTNSKEILKSYLTTKAKANPLNITSDPFLNKNHRLPYLVKSFEDDLLNNLKRLQFIQGNVTVNEFKVIAVYYAIDLMIEYRDKALNILPNSIVDDIKNQVSQAASNLIDAFKQESLINDFNKMIDTKIYEPNIEIETQKYMSQFQ